jgi:hypothetical protein
MASMCSSSLSFWPLLCRGAGGARPSGSGGGAIAHQTRRVDYWQLRSQSQDTRRVWPRHRPSPGPGRGAGLLGRLRAREGRRGCLCVVQLALELPELLENLEGLCALGGRDLLARLRADGRAKLGFSSHARLGACCMQAGTFALRRRRVWTGSMLNLESDGRVVCRRCMLPVHLPLIALGVGPPHSAQAPLLYERMALGAMETRVGHTVRPGLASVEA